MINKSFLTGLFGLIFLISGSMALAQEEDKVSTKEVKPSRYDGILGSPYIYEQWANADIIGMDGKIYHENFVNYNGLTDEIEVKYNSNVNEITSGSYLKVIIKKDNHSESFIRGLHPRLGMKQICVIYDGSRVKLLKNFVVKKEEFAGPNSIDLKFIPRTEYYLMEDGRLQPTALRKKKILNALRLGSDLEAYVKKNSLALKTESQVIEFLAYYENSYLQ